MPQERIKIFVSAVTSEFGEVRDAIASDLRARGHTVHVQSDFRQGTNNATLLSRLAEYIRDCHAVVCIVGKQCGSLPPKSAAEGFPSVIPDKLKEASFTQWEFFLSTSYYKRRTYVYLAKDAYSPEQPAAKNDRTDLQETYVKFLKDQGVHHTSFPTAEELRIAVMRDEPKIAAEPETDMRPATKPIVLPYPSIGALFKGRDEFMARLRASLTREPGARTAIVSHALYGLGGIGKTRAAVEYAWANADEHSALLFAVAETPEALRRNLAALAGALVPNLDTTDDQVRLAAVLDWLKANPGWFLILDNVDGREALAEVERLLRDLAGGHVVVTSRLADFSGNFQPLELDVLSVDDAASFLLARTERRRRTAPYDEDNALEVARELGQLALALEQAAAFIGKRRLTFTQYLEQWRSKRGEALAWFDETVTGYPRSVAVTWQTSVAQLTEGGRRFLQRLAWLAPEKIPESLLDTPIPGAEGESPRDAYEDLAGYSLVTRDAERPFFLVHRLVQDVTRRSLLGAARPSRLSDALGWVNAAFAGDSSDVRKWPTLDPLLPHARTVAAYADDAAIPEPTAQLMNQLGQLLYNKALHAEAEPLWRRALAIDEKSHGPDHPNVAIRLNNLAQLLQATSRHAEAEPLMRRVLAIDEKRFGPDDREIATDLNNLALLLQDTNRLAEAEPLMRRALAIDEKNYGPDDPNLSIRLNNVAGLLQDTNRLAEAEPLMRRALAIDEKSFGVDHPRVATRLDNLAGLLHHTNRLAEAEPLIRRALAIDESSYGPDHPSVGIHLNNLAQLLQATNRFTEAEPLTWRAHEISEKYLGPDHPDVAIRLSNLALLLERTNRLAKAEPMMRRAIEIAVKFICQTGHRHPNLDARLDAYRRLLSEMGKSQPEIDAACAELMRPLGSKSSS
jgi:tetratricopeptide (TPR) repeat protein